MSTLNVYDSFDEAMSATITDWQYPVPPSLVIIDGHAKFAKGNLPTLEDLRREDKEIPPTFEYAASGHTRRFWSATFLLGLSWMIIEDDQGSNSILSYWAFTHRLRMENHRDCLIKNYDNAPGWNRVGG